MAVCIRVAPEKGTGTRPTRLFPNIESVMKGREPVPFFL